MNSYDIFEPARVVDNNSGNVIVKYLGNYLLQQMRKRVNSATCYEQTKLLFGALPISILGTLLGIFVIVFILYDAVDNQSLAIWTTVFILITALRGIHTYFYFKTPPVYGDAHPWCLQFAIGALAASLAWGSTAIWLFPEDDLIKQVLLAFSLSVTCAVSITVLSAVRFIIVAYIVAALLPLVIRFYVQDHTSISAIMTLIVSIIFPLFIITAIRTSQFNLANIALRLEATTQARKIRQSQQRLTLHMKQTPLAVIEWDKELNVTEWNESARKIFGFRREEIINKNGIELLVPEYARDYVKEVRNGLVNNTGGLYSLNENLTRDGQVIICEWFNTPLVDDNENIIGIASLVQDVTERIRMEKLKVEFVSRVSHELRTPLTAIRGSLGLILGGVTSDIGKKTKELLEIANNNTQRLLLIVNDILDIDKIESGNLEYCFQNMNLMPILDQAVENNISYALQFDVNLIITQRLNNAFVSADGNRIMQVLDNLVSNAIKVSSKNGTVELKLTEQNNNFRISVVDHGPGIPEEFHSKLFDKFTQLATATRSVGGTGLGLSIAKSVVEHHNGTIGFATKEKQGTTFYFELPKVSVSNTA